MSPQINSPAQPPLQDPPLTPDGQQFTVPWAMFFVLLAAGAFPTCEVPQGAINGVNKVFTVTRSMQATPPPLLMLSGAVQDPLNAPVDFTYAGNTLTYSIAPEANAKHVIWYWPKS